MSSELLDDLILKIHSAPLEPEVWPSILNDICELLHAGSATGMRFSERAGELAWHALVRYDASAIEEYASCWSPRDEWLQGAVRQSRIRSGLISRGEELVDRHTFLRSEFTNDFLRRYDMDRMINVCVAQANAGMGLGAAAFSFYRPHGRNAFSNADAELLARLAPHLVLATRNFWLARALALRKALHAQAVDALNVAVFGVGRGSRALFANRLGEKFAQQDCWVKVRRGCVSPGRFVENSRAFNQLLGELEAGRGSTVLLNDRRTGKQSMLSAVPITPGTDLFTNTRGAFGLLWIVPFSLDVIPIAQVAYLFGLTRAEQRLLSHLVEGEDLRSAADELGVSIHTVRNQLKCIFRKTGRSTQSQLIALVHRFATIQDFPASQ